MFIPSKNRLVARLILFLTGFILFLTSFVKSNILNPEIPRGNIIFVLDISNSMNVEDVYYNGHLVSRLDLAKKIIENSVKKYKEKFGLILISDKMDYFIPPTYDKDTFLLYLDTINTNNLNGGDFNFEKSMNEIAKVLNFQDIAILISDFDFSFNKSKLRYHNFTYLIGVGDKKNEIVKNKSGEIIKVNGEYLKSNLGEKTIKDLAKILKAKYKILNSYNLNSDILDFIIQQKGIMNKNNNKINWNEILAFIIVLTSL